MGLFAVAYVRSSPPQPSHIEIFVDDTDRLKNLGIVNRGLAPTIEIQLYNLSAPERFKQTISADLPSNPEAAKKRAMERIAKIDPKTLKEQLLIDLGIAYR